MPSHLEHQISNLLQKCTFKQLKQIHGFIITNSLNQNLEISSKLLRQSTEFGGMDYSELLFSQMNQIYPDKIFLWNAMIRGYAYNGPEHKCIDMFDKMSQRGIKPNNYTYPYVLNSFCKMGNCRDGKKIHSQIIKAGFEGVFVVANSLLNFYLMRDVHKMGVVEIETLTDAQKVFDYMIVKPVELWNRMMSACANLGEVECGRKLFEEMPERDIVSWNSMISCYAKVGDIKSARDLFDRMPEKNVVTWTTMVGALANSGDLNTARRFFEIMPEKNAVSWSSMISNYTRHEKFEEALELFVRMQSEGISMDGFVYVSVLSACAHLCALDFGRWVHVALMKDWCQYGVIVGTALLEMYAICGDVDRAFKIFIKMGNKDIFCWNVMIRSLAIHGRTKDAIKIFNMMKQNELKPNEYTVTNALFACNHGGLVEEGQQIFYKMKTEFGIDPMLKHYGCFIDLLSRNGQVEEAYSLAKTMPFEPDIAVWGSLLGGCRIKNDVKLAEEVMDRISKLETDDSGVYVLLSNIYASLGQWPEALSIRERMEKKRIRKKAGYSSVSGVVSDGG